MLLFGKGNMNEFCNTVAWSKIRVMYREAMCIVYWNDYCPDFNAEKIIMDFCIWSRFLNFIASVQKSLLDIYKISSKFDFIFFFKVSKWNNVKIIYIILIEILFNIFHRRITQKHSFLKDKFWIIYLLLGVNKIQMVKVNFSINVFYIYNINDNRKIPQTTPT